RGRRGFGGAAGGADRRLQGAVREPVLGRRARVRRRRDRAETDAAVPDPRARGDALEARAGPEAQARQHPAVAALGRCSAVTKPARCRHSLVTSVVDFGDRIESGWWDGVPHEAVANCAIRRPETATSRTWPGPCAPDARLD